MTWTGDGTGERVINHSLSVAPTVIIYKRTSTTGPWSYSQWDGTESKWLRLNETGASSTSNLVGGYISPEPSVGAATPTSITLLGNSGVTQVNTTGATYVAYLFAHNAGGFGLSGTDNVISCGTFTTDGAGAATVTLGYEPQWVMTKSSSGTSAWRMFDTMRRLTVAGQNDALLQAQSSAAEITNSDYCSPTATGFTIDGHTGSETHIYIAIRRGPMKVPTSGTSVFTPAIRTGTGTTTTVTGVGFPLDVVLSSSRNYPAYGGYLGQFWDRLRGAGRALRTPETAAEVTVTNAGVLGQDGYTVSASSGGQNDSSDPFVDYSFRRAPSFFDEVCYTGTGSATTFAHNLGAVPELMITKCRGDAFGWAVYSSPVGNTAALFLETTAIPDTNTAYWNNTTPTSTVFSVGSASRTNRTSLGMVAYLFATCAGVSKVGSYTGNGTTQTIDCGFTGGARFVLIKRTDSTGDWYVYDTARGMTTLTDPYLLLNNTAAEAATLGSVTTVSTGFALNSTILAAINVSAGTYIFLAIA